MKPFVYIFILRKLQIENVNLIQRLSITMIYTLTHLIKASESRTFLINFIAMVYIPSENRKSLNF